MKVPGTQSLKGENTQERPYRIAKILNLGTKEIDAKLMQHIRDISFHHEKEAKKLQDIPKSEWLFFTDKRIHNLKPCQKHFLRKGKTLGVSNADRNEETGLRINFVRSLNNSGFSEKEILDIFALCEDFSKEKSLYEIKRILAEKSGAEWSCKAIRKNKGCLGRICRHYLGNIEYADIDSKQFVTFRKGIPIGINYALLVSKIQQVYMFLSTSARSHIWVYNESTGIWDAHGEEVIRQTVKVWLDFYFRSHHATEIVKQILFGNYSPDIFTDVQTKNRNYIVLQNGVYNLETDKLENFDPYLYALNKIPITYDPNAQCPAIEKFISEIAQPNDIVKLEELIGYCLYKSYKIARIIILEGNGANGKSTFLRLLGAFLGHKNVAHVSVQQILEGGFKTAEMYGKLANLCGDLPKKPLKDTATIKKLTGEDYAVAEKKFKDPFDFYNFAKQIYASNEVPPTWDDSIAFHRRFLIIPFLNIFLDGEKTTDLNILVKLTTPEELSGLFNLAIKRLKGLLERGKFDNEPTIEEKRETYIRKSNPIQYFAEWFVEKDLHNWISKADLYTDYVNLCMKVGKTPTASNVFSKEVRRFLPYIMEFKKKLNQIGNDETRRVTGWKGIKVLTAKINQLKTREKQDEWKTTSPQQQPLFESSNVKSIVSIENDGYEGVCYLCENKRVLCWRIVNFKDEHGDVCQDCAGPLLAQKGLFE